MDAKNTCDGRRNDRSHMDYKGADDVQDAFSIVSVHDRFVKDEKLGPWQVDCSDMKYAFK